MALYWKRNEVKRVSSLKINTGTPAAPVFVLLDCKNLETVDSIHFREYNGKLQYSTDGVNWT